MDPLTLSLIISGITVIGSIVTSLFNRSNVNSTNASNQQISSETNEASSLLAQQQHDWNIADWNRENAYNLPSSQMSRFRDAGLNPSLIYGQMSNGPSINSTNLPSLQMIPNTPFQAENPFQNSASDILSFAQARKTDVETDIMQQKLPHEIQALRETNEQLRAEINRINQEVLESQRRIQSMDIEDQLKVAQKVRLEFQSQFDSRNFELAKMQFEQDVKESNSRIGLNNAQRDNYKSITRLNNRQYREMLGTWKYRLLGFDLQDQQIQSALNLTQEEINNARLNSQLLGFQVDNGRISNVLDNEFYDDLTGKNGWYHYYKTKMALKLSRDIKSFGDSGRLLFRVGK